MWLALVPLGVSVTLGLLLLPRRATPDSVPLPLADARGLAASAAEDHRLADEARREPLPATVRALGSALRDFHALESHPSEESQLGRARQAIEAAVPAALEAGDPPLLRLRAVQLETFLAEVRSFESTGVESEELGAVAGSFIRGMQYEGWLDGHAVLASDGARRAMFKEMWNTLVGVATRPPFPPPLDEERALYAVYLARPHPGRAMREAIAAGRRGSRDASACEALVQAERGAVEAWRLERIGRLAAIDPEYPAAYARGAANLRRGEFTRAAADFSAWVRDHPDGPLALRARAYLRTALGASHGE
jgi:hypothetical protein